MCVGNFTIAIVCPMDNCCKSFSMELNQALQLFADELQVNKLSEIQHMIIYFAIKPGLKIYRIDFLTKHKVNHCDIVNDTEKCLKRPS